MKKQPRRKAGATAPAFSLLEVLISMVILVTVITLTFSAISHLSRLWQKSRSDIDAFQVARAAFDQITRNLSQATLNPYWDYRKDASGVPTQYIRRSDLHFVCGKATDTLLSNSITHSLLFQAPLGRTETGLVKSTSNLLCSLGYYIAFQDDSSTKPNWIKNLPGIKNKSRFRLIEVEQATEDFKVFGSTGAQPDWLTNAVSRPIADNIIALILSPRLANQDDPEGDDLAPSYSYNSRKDANLTSQPVTANQLPPCVMVTMIAISEASAARLTRGESSPDTLKNTITDILQGHFQQVANYTNDLSGTNGVTAQLASRRIEYRVFSTIVPLRESKWSQ